MKRVFNVYNVGLMLVVALVSALVLKTVDVNAAGTITWDHDNNKITIDRTVTNVVNPVTTTFGYTITADSGNPTGATGAPTTASVVFNNATPASNQVEQTQDVDFSGMSFDKPGDYTYVLAEASTTDSAYPVDSTDRYTAVLQVRNDLDANGVPTGNFTVTMIVKDKDNNKVTASGGKFPAPFTSAASASNFGHIALEKTVKGNAADLNEYFAYTITLGGTGTHTITGLDASTPAGSNPSTITGGTATTIYVKHGQKILIGQEGTGQSAFDTIPVGTTYSIAEAANGYTAEYSVNGGTAVSSDTLSGGTITAAENSVAFTNTKTQQIATGILTTVIPYILLIAIGVGGTLAYMTLKEKKEAQK